MHPLVFFFSCLFIIGLFGFLTCSGVLGIIVWQDPMPQAGVIFVIGAGLLFWIWSSRKVILKMKGAPKVKEN